MRHKRQTKKFADNYGVEKGVEIYLIWFFTMGLLFGDFRRLSDRGRLIRCIYKNFFFQIFFYLIKNLLLWFFLLLLFISKFKIFGFYQKFDFWQRFRFLTKISVFEKKKSIFYNNFDFFTKISILGKNFDFWQNITIHFSRFLQFLLDFLIFKIFHVFYSVKYLTQFTIILFKIEIFVKFMIFRPPRRF